PRAARWRPWPPAARACGPSPSTGSAWAKGWRTCSPSWPTSSPPPCWPTERGSRLSATPPARAALSFPERLGARELVERLLRLRRQAIEPGADPAHREPGLRVRLQRRLVVVARHRQVVDLAQ